MSKSVDPVLLEQAEVLAALVVDKLRHTQPTVPEYLSPDAASVFLGVPVRTLANWRAVGAGGPRFMRFGNTIRYSVAELRRWAAEHEIGGDA